MNETLNLTLSTNPAMIEAVAVVASFVFLGVVAARLSSLAKTIREKDFSFKPEYSKFSGELLWKDNSVYPWNRI